MGEGCRLLSFLLVAGYVCFTCTVAQPAIVDVVFASDLSRVTIQWETSACPVGSTETWSLVYRCSRSVDSDEDFTTTEPFDVPINGDEVYREKVIALPQMITTEDNRACIFKVQSGQNNDCTARNTTCVIVTNISSFTMLDRESPEENNSHCFSLTSCYGNLSPFFLAWNKQGDMEDIPCPDYITTYTVRQPDGTDKLTYKVTGNESTGNVCLNQQVTQAIELCTVANTHNTTISVCGGYSFLFKAKVLGPTGTSSNSSTTQPTVTITTSSPPPATPIPDRTIIPTAVILSVLVGVPFMAALIYLIYNTTAIVRKPKTRLSEVEAQYKK